MRPNSWKYSTTCSTEIGSADAKTREQGLSYEVFKQKQIDRASQFWKFQLVRNKGYNQCLQLDIKHPSHRETAYCVGEFWKST